MKRLLPFLLFLSVSFSIQAQDFTYSQYFVNKTQLNPAFSAQSSGLRFAANYRNQWLSVPGTLTSYNASLNLDLPNLFGYSFGGVGLDLQQTREGSAKLLNTIVTPSFSAMIPLVENRLAISAGMKFGFHRTQIDWTKLTFSDQLSPLGLTQPISNATLSDHHQSPTNGYSIGTGITLVYNSKKPDGIFAVLGTTINYLPTTPNQSLYRTEASTYPRYTLHAHFLLPISWKASWKDDYKFTLSPVIKWEYQNQHQSYTLGLNVIKSNLLFGFHWQNRAIIPDKNRHTNALTGLIGFRWAMRNNELANQILVSYDVNLSGLGQNNTKGVLELSFVFWNPYGLRFGNKRARASKKRSKKRKQNYKCPNKYKRRKVKHGSLLQFDSFL